MHRASFVVLLISLCRISIAADAFVLVSKVSPSVGRVTEETTSIVAKDGKLTARLGSLPIQGSATALLRDKLTRTVKSVTEQRIDFHDCTRDISFSFSKDAPPAAKSNPGRLAGRSLLALRDADGEWSYKLDDGKPTSGAKGSGKAKSAEATAITQFSVFQIALDSLAKLYGEEPREIGKPWRPDFSELSKKYPVSVFIDCRLDEVGERDGDKIALITVGGLANGQYGKNRIDVRFAGTILRSLRDQLDIDVRLNGTLKFEGSLVKTDDDDDKPDTNSKGQSATVEVPLTLTRNLKVRNGPN